MAQWCNIMIYPLAEAAEFNSNSSVNRPSSINNRSLKVLSSLLGICDYAYTKTNFMLGHI